MTTTLTTTIAEITKALKHDGEGWSTKAESQRLFDMLVEAAPALLALAAEAIAAREVVKAAEAVVAAWVKDQGAHYELANLKLSTDAHKSACEGVTNG